MKSGFLRGSAGSIPAPGTEKGELNIGCPFLYFMIHFLLNDLIATPGHNFDGFLSSLGCRYTPDAKRQPTAIYFRPQSHTFIQV